MHIYQNSTPDQLKRYAAQLVHPAATVKDVELVGTEELRIWYYLPNGQFLSEVI